MQCATAQLISHFLKPLKRKRSAHCRQEVATCQQSNNVTGNVIKAKSYKDINYKAFLGIFCIAKKSTLSVNANTDLRLCGIVCSARKIFPYEKQQHIVDKN